MTSVEREQAILSLKHRVRFEARRIARTVPRDVSVDDLTSAGWVGAIHAVDRYDPGHGNTLATFAHLHIRGAILDHLRSLDYLTRWQRKSLNEAGEGAPAEIRFVPLLPNNPDDRSAAATLPDPRCQRERERLEARIHLESLFRRAMLKARSRRVLEEIHFLGEPLRSIGRTLGISQGRVSQIAARGIRDLRKAA